MSFCRLLIEDAASMTSAMKEIKDQTPNAKALRPPARD